MKKAFLFGICFLLFSSSSSHARKWQEFFPFFKKPVPVEGPVSEQISRVTGNIISQRPRDWVDVSCHFGKTSAKASAGPSLAKTQNYLAHMKQLDATAITRVGRLQDKNEWEPFFSSSFFVREVYQGKPYIWGVTAAHISENLGSKNAQVSIFLDEQLNYSSEVEFVQKGNTGFADVAIFRVDEDCLRDIQPLPLAADLPKPGEVLRSYGYFENEFHITPGRVVQEVSPSRIVTSFEFGDASPAGSCGGPVLNSNNEVIGIHCGSARKQNKSFVIPAQHIRNVISAYHNNGIHETPLLLNGQEIGTIGIDEYIYAMSAIKNNIPINVFHSHHHELKVDYAHLENMISLQGMDQLEIFLMKGATLIPSSDSFPLESVRTHLIVNLRTGGVERSTW